MVTDMVHFDILIIVAYNPHTVFVILSCPLIRILAFILVRTMQTVEQIASLPETKARQCCFFYRILYATLSWPSSI